MVRRWGHHWNSPRGGFPTPWAGWTPTPTIRIPHVTRAPKLADFLDGNPREAETVVTDFRQYEPGDGEPVSQPTTAYLSYDDKTCTWFRREG